jgi:Flp pilus assembly protein TadG
MMRRLLGLLRNDKASAAAEMALLTPLLLALMFGSFELGNLFMDEHALEKQVRDGARFGARLTLNEDYSCGSPATVFEADDAEDQIKKVTKDGAVSGTGNPRWSAYWSRNCTDDTPTLSVTIRCVPKASIDTEASGKTGIYTGLDGDIPVVKVSGSVKYRSVLAPLGLNATNVCLTAESEAAVQGV